MENKKYITGTLDKQEFTFLKKDALKFTVYFMNNKFSQVQDFDKKLEDTQNDLNALIFKDTKNKNIVYSSQEKYKIKERMNQLVDLFFKNDSEGNISFDKVKNEE